MNASTRPRIAHITPVIPATGGNGLAMRTSMFAEAAAQLGECTCLVVGAPEGRLGQYSLPSGVRVDVIESYQDTRLKLIAMAQPAGARPQMLLDYGLPSLAGRMPATTAGVIAKRLGELQPDLLVISRAYMLPVLDHLPKAMANMPVAVDLDDDDAAFQMTAARLAHLNGKFDDAALYEAEAILFDRLIESRGKRVNRFWIASELSRTAMAARLQLNNLSVANNAVDITARRMPAKITPPCLLFVGNLGYQPNRKGICWFIRESLPQVRKRYPDLNVVIAGSSCPPDLRKTCRDAGLSLVDAPLSLDPLYAEATAVIVPLRIGSGSRLKIIEAGAYGIPVISTHTGAEGLGLDTANHYFHSDDSAAGFATACNECLDDPAEALRRAQLLREFVAERHDRMMVVEQIQREMRFLLQC